MCFVNFNAIYLGINHKLIAFWFKILNVLSSLWRNCHFLHAVDVLHVDQGGEDGFDILVVHVRPGLLLHGGGRLQTHIRKRPFLCSWVDICTDYLCFPSCQVSSWGGYVFLINLIPLHVLVLMLTGRFSHRIYVAYCTVYCLGTILSMQISFVGFQVDKHIHVLHVWWVDRFIFEW